MTRQIRFMTSVLAILAPVLVSAQEFQQPPMYLVPGEKGKWSTNPPNPQISTPIPGRRTPSEPGVIGPDGINNRMVPPAPRPQPRPAPRQNAPSPQSPNGNSNANNGPSRSSPIDSFPSYQDPDSPFNKPHQPVTTETCHSCIQEWKRQRALIQNYFENQPMFESQLAGRSAVVPTQSLGVNDAAEIQRLRSSGGALVMLDHLDTDGVVSHLNAMGIFASTASQEEEKDFTSWYHHYKEQEVLYRQALMKKGLEATRADSEAVRNALDKSSPEILGEFSRASKELDDVKFTPPKPFVNEPEWFAKKDQELADKLDSNGAYSPQQQNLRNLSMRMMDVARDSLGLGDAETARRYAEYARQFADAVVGLDPVTGVGRGVYEAFTGRNLITGVKLSTFERSLAAGNVILLGAGSHVMAGLRIAGKLGVRVAKLERAMLAAERLGGAMKEKTVKTMAAIWQGSRGKALNDQIYRSLYRNIFRYAEGYEVKTVLSAEEINERFLLSRIQKGQTWEQALANERPYQAWTHALDVATTKDELYVRFAFAAENKPGVSGPIGSWIMKASEVAELRASGKSVDEIALIIQKRYSLPQPPKFVADVLVPAKSNLTVGRVGEQFGGAEGAMQYYLNDRLPPANFQGNVRSIKDWTLGK